jgi:hypothetical protein
MITYLSSPEIALGVTYSLYNSTLLHDVSNPIQGFLYNSASDIAISLEPSSMAMHDPKGTYISPLYSISMVDFSHSFGQISNAWI